MTFKDYAQIIESLVSHHWAVDTYELTARASSQLTGKIICKINFLDHSYIDFSEEVSLETEILNIRRYRYEHVKNKRQVFRYDNFPNHPGISFPFHHKHTFEGIIQLEAAPKLIDIIDEATRIIF